MLGSSLYDYSNAYILVKGTITVPNTGTVAAANIRKKKGISKNCKDTDVVMPMYNLKKHLEDYGYGFMMFLMILMMHYLNINKKQQVKQEIMEQKMFK